MTCTKLYPRVGFIVTNMSRPVERVVAFYNNRGKCEQWIKEGKGFRPIQKIAAIHAISGFIWGIPTHTSLCYSFEAPQPSTTTNRPRLVTINRN